ncbi:MAG: hypothetical protein ACAI38_06790 [Myxococcota bacterium]|nr:hypothetical protein [Myxococcota bacterium]
MAVILPATAHAGFADLRLALEPGIASLHEGGVTNWAPLGGGGSVSIGLIERLQVTANFDRKEFTNREPTLAARAIGAGVRYDIDVLWLTPFLELGFGNVYLRAANGGTYGPTWDLFFGIGADVRITRWLFGGIVFRYYSVGGTDLFTNPAYSTINARLGFMIGASSPSVEQNLSEARANERHSYGSSEDPGRSDNDT